MKIINFLIKLRKTLKEKTYLDYLNPFFNEKKISIRYWFGGFGNNLIQISNLLLFAKFNNLKFNISKHELLDNDKIQSLNTHNSYFSKSQTYADLNLENKKFKNYFSQNLRTIYYDEIFNLFSFYKDLNLQSDELVIHLRPMAIVSNHSFKFVDQKSKIQNPLNYYLEVIPKYKKVTVVINNVLSNPILPFLINLPNVNIQSGTDTEDFNYILNAKSLMLSTSSSFAICAALSSRKLETIYYSDLNFENDFVKSIECSNIYRLNLLNYFKENDSYNLNQIYKKMLSEEVQIVVEKLK